MLKTLFSYFVSFLEERVGLGREEALAVPPVQVPENSSFSAQGLF